MKDTSQRVLIVRQSRKGRLLDRFIIKMFKKVLLRWCDRHLSIAKECSVINNVQLHSLDAQMKGDLGFPGYVKLK